MILIIECLIVGIGGFIGSVIRYIIGLIQIPSSSLFPINTFIINVSGAVLISFLSFYFTKNINNNEYLILLLKVGICGGFTTFSTFALETADLIKSGNTFIAFIYVLLSVIIGVSVMFLPEIICK